MFRPINNHVEVEPIEEDSLIASQQNGFEEKGKVISIAPEVTKSYVFMGDVIYFDSWLVAKYPDSQGKIRYLVPFDAIRAVENPPSAAMIAAIEASKDIPSKTRKLTREDI